MNEEITISVFDNIEEAIDFEQSFYLINDLTYIYKVNHNGDHWNDKILGS